MLTPCLPIAAAAAVAAAAVAAGIVADIQESPFLGAGRFFICFWVIECPL